MPVRRTHTDTARALARRLKARLAVQRLAVFVDEAQRLQDDTLEELRLLAESELEAPSLFSVVLAGPPEFRERFETGELFAFKRRLSPSLELTGLRQEECRPFLEKRLGSRSAARFRDDALVLVFERGRGIPALVEKCAKAVLERATGNDPLGKQATASVLDGWEGI
jgi:type II secretory pathway predicted ATPase ExeA